MAEHELIGSGWRNSFEMISRLSAVTPADVQRVAQKYMRNIRFVVLGDLRALILASSRARRGIRPGGRSRWQEAEGSRSREQQEAGGSCLLLIGLTQKLSVKLLVELLENASMS